ncbi:uncharacterized protein LOC131679689 [Topomyia yanbarensis]|uniref:uncharacterized protein LOC131679689 n=1 Tax=Topomyia yanbarensis TaxID=2498891 RepID=UPI00273BF2BD|nr:uncharacterized protein LOC131679689 [Topomyia yanbarensis]
MGLLEQQKRLLVLLNIFGVVPIHALLNKDKVHRDSSWRYVSYVLTVQTVLALIGTLEIVLPTGLEDLPNMDKTSRFVSITGYCHWHVILFLISLHSAIYSEKLAKLYAIIATIERTYSQIIDALQDSDLLFGMLQAFNNYYGLFMIGMCMTAFLRSSFVLWKQYYDKHLNGESVDDDSSALIKSWTRAADNRFPTPNLVEDQKEIIWLKNNKDQLPCDRAEKEAKVVFRAQN